MRVLIANDGAADGGGVDTYLKAVGLGLRDRGHEIAYLFCNESPFAASGAGFAAETINVHRLGERDGVDAAVAWRPDVVYSHNMAALEIERALLERLPVVKFMHGYFGTCISGLKMHEFPQARPCCRQFGAACLALYVPRRCGQLSLRTMVRQYRWACQQRGLFSRYRAVVVGSRHMGEEYVRNGVPRENVVVNPLFASTASTNGCNGRHPGANAQRLLFLGRMTKLKGGDVLIRAVAQAQSSLGKPLPLVMAGDGPQRLSWERLARQLGVAAEFPGWLDEMQRAAAIEHATLLVMPSVWPEPFGLVGLEAARQGVPAVAFDLGGVREWLTPGVNGLLASGSPPTANGLAATIVDCLSDSIRLEQMGAAARLRAEELSLSAHLLRLEQLFGTIRASA